MYTQRYVYKDGFILRYIKIIIHLKSAILAAQFVRQKDESQNGCLKKTMPAKFSSASAYQEVRHVRFSENLTCFEAPVLRLNRLP